MASGMKTDHIDAKTLEGYALDHLEEPELASVEEHLLVCQECCYRVMEAEAEAQRYVRAMREALRRLAEEAPDED